VPKEGDVMSLPSVSSGGQALCLRPGCPRDLGWAAPWQALRSHPGIGLKLATIFVPVLSPIFKSEPLTVTELAVMVVLSVTVFIAVEIEKMIKRKNQTA
jgi:hypothetical protein